MGLGLNVSSGGGDFMPIIKYDARAGRIHKIDRVQGADPISTEITNNFTAVFDLANIEVGWALFRDGMAPDWHMVRVGQPKPARPSPEHKAAFRVNVKLTKQNGGDVREFGSAARCVIVSIDVLHDAYAASDESKRGMLPVVAMVGTEQIKSGGGAKSSTNYQPKFEIKSWVERPADMVQVAPTVQANPAKQPSQTSITDDDVEF